MVAWTTAVARLAEAEGISWTYFELATDDLGAWDRAAGEWREPLYGALQPVTEQPWEPWASCEAAPQPVGGIALDSDLEPLPLAVTQTPSGNAGVCFGIGAIAAAAAGVAALGGVAWYARKRLVS
jgi:hypothetical protein